MSLEASGMFLTLHMIASQERAAVVWEILERISGFDPSLIPGTGRSPMLVAGDMYLDVSLEVIWVVCHHFCFAWTNHHFVPCDVYKDVSFFLLFCIYDDAICKVEVGNQPSSDADTTFMVIQCLTHDSL